MLKGGLTYADAITTVSATYAEEIKTDFYGEKLNGLLTARTHDLRGIVNGIDYNEYNPETDQFIVHHYNASNFRKEKIKNKRDLQKQLGLVENDKKMMIGIVSRLTDQKGMDLVAYIMDEMCSTDDVQLVVLGTGEERYENMFRHFDWKYNNKVSAKHLLFGSVIPQDLCGKRCLPYAFLVRALRTEPVDGVTVRHSADCKGDRRIKGYGAAL